MIDVEHVTCWEFGRYCNDEGCVRRVPYKGASPTSAPVPPQPADAEAWCRCGDMLNPDDVDGVCGACAWGARAASEARAASAPVQEGGAGTGRAVPQEWRELASQPCDVGDRCLAGASGGRCPPCKCRSALAGRCWLTGAPCPTFEACVGEECCMGADSAEAATPPSPSPAEAPPLVTVVDFPCPECRYVLTDCALGTAYHCTRCGAGFIAQSAPVVTEAPPDGTCERCGGPCEPVQRFMCPACWTRERAAAVVAEAPPSTTPAETPPRDPLRSSADTPMSAPSRKYAHDTDVCTCGDERGQHRDPDDPDSSACTCMGCNCVEFELATPAETPGEPMCRLWCRGRCRGCGTPLSPMNLWMADGCPCNAGRGVNHGLVPKDACTCSDCDPAESGSSRITPSATPVGGKP